MYSTNSHRVLRRDMNTRSFADTEWRLRRYIPHRAYLRPRQDAADRSQGDDDVYQDTRQRPSAAEMYARTRSPTHACTPAASAISLSSQKNETSCITRT